MSNSGRPIIINPISLSAFLTHIISLSHRTHLIICSSRPHFLQHIYSSLDRNHLFLAPSLSLLSNSSAISVAFCPTVQTLLAYLATFPGSGIAQQDLNNSTSPQTVALVFPLSIHINTTAHSAQGLSRMFASAIEASVRAQARLIIAEPVLPDLDFITTSDIDDGEENAELQDPQSGDPWANEVPLLNITSSKFRAEQRGWVGRTVTARTVGERWC